ncbi:diguanylate cyclase, partial [bacterium]|nr:diguanylate cyclase [bacterium]
TRQVAEMLRRTIENETFETVDKISCSFGVAALEENESSEALLRRVDRLLYRAKESGRNCVVA